MPFMTAIIFLVASEYELEYWDRTNTFSLSSVQTTTHVDLKRPSVISCTKLRCDGGHLSSAVSTKIPVLPSKKNIWKSRGLWMSLEIPSWTTLLAGDTCVCVCVCAANVVSVTFSYPFDRMLLRDRFRCDEMKLGKLREHVSNISRTHHTNQKYKINTSIYIYTW